jgi:hypothetical protein
MHNFFKSPCCLPVKQQALPFYRFVPGALFINQDGRLTNVWVMAAGKVVPSNGLQPHLYRRDLCYGSAFFEVYNHQVGKIAFADIAPFTDVETIGHGMAHFLHYLFQGYLAFFVILQHQEQGVLHQRNASVCFFVWFRFSPSVCGAWSVAITSRRSSSRAFQSASRWCGALIGRIALYLVAVLRVIICREVQVVHTHFGGNALFGQGHEVCKKLQFLCRADVQDMQPAVVLFGQLNGFERRFETGFLVPDHGWSAAVKTSFSLSAFQDFP